MPESLNHFYNDILKPYWIIFGFTLTIIPGLIAIYDKLPKTYTLNKLWIAVLIGIIYTLTILLVVVTYKLWVSYKNSKMEVEDNITELCDITTDPKVVDFINSDQYGGEFIFLIESKYMINNNSIAELKRSYNGIEVTIAIIEIVERNSNGQYQAKHLWISGGHLSDLQQHSFTVSEINVDLIIKSDTLNKYLEDPT